ncbi:diaminopimelate epimerase [Clostridium pascui]|uniref:diaminopimelate epimerase n=1 Tax=Clostridium pascui TaxID=46609 RepID=UPI001956CEF3|nr:diaminopimelate epimerase [Clostridium pascui]MBM7869345.1 diaminopimelate epimerase [Clostridium pascui]
MKFVKMHGNGNDFVVIEDIDGIYKENYGDIAKELCDRHFGIGADGLIIVTKSTIAPIQMIIINADGSYASMCGNGIRCFAKYVYDNNIVKEKSMKIETGDGIKEAFLEVRNDKAVNIKIDMGTPSFKPKHIPANSDDEIIEKELLINDRTYTITSLLMGVPHTVIIGKLEDSDVTEGSVIEKCELFPNGTNVNFCEIVDRENIKVKTWERGAGPTLACGTGSCASVVACNKLGIVSSKVRVELPGGILDIEVGPLGVFMKGPAETVFVGEYKLE